MHYRRSVIPGGTYFFTVNLFDRKQTLLLDHIALLRDAVSQVKARHSFSIDGMVILPDHLHAIWTLPDGDRDYSKRWMLIKASFSRGIMKGEQISMSRKAKGERGIWQRRYWEHLIRDDEDFQRHVDYIHYNPVKHGWVKRASDWPYSSIHRYIKKGVLDPNWGVSDVTGGVGFGE
ncbi:REP-associated tyrosine transposase [Sedimenticola selenatireducens]|uniref:Transposase n=1 Tax=Sedimenticola selenatireducens TaxID=191960 RepID=A0A557S9K1_9GAMM|nr:transposase [Sedimenticola selenatireducens]TVO74102.1 transposase [Sedimenticola selenatireducens]TVT61622.1 MAG: transposase [Sedimenticola selenatireducens]